MLIRLRPLHGIRTHTPHPLISSTPPTRLSQWRSSLQCCRVLRTAPSDRRHVVENPLAPAFVRHDWPGGIAPARQRDRRVVSTSRDHVPHRRGSEHRKGPRQGKLIFLFCRAPLGGARAPCQRCRAHTPRPLAVKSPAYTHIFALPYRGETSCEQSREGNGKHAIHAKRRCSQSVPRLGLSMLGQYLHAFLFLELQGVTLRYFFKFFFFQAVLAQNAGWNPCCRLQGNAARFSSGRGELQS